MPALKNAKYEKLAQELAKGASASAAYVAAGFKANRGRASVLSRDSNIVNRVSELLQEKRSIDTAAMAAAIEATALSKEWVLSRLKENVERAMQARPVLDEDGKAIGDFKYDGNVANRALELLGKELGMFVDRSEHLNKNVDVSGTPGPTIEEWADKHDATTTAH